MKAKQRVLLSMCRNPKVSLKKIRLKTELEHASVSFFYRFIELFRIEKECDGPTLETV